jgi:hypothetical protein
VVKVVLPDLVVKVLLNVVDEEVLHDSVVGVPLPVDVTAEDAVVLKLLWTDVEVI